MLDTHGLPDYPPPTNAWDYPPPPVSPRWKWVAIAATVLAAVVAAALLTVAIVFGSRDYRAYIDDSELLDVIAVECDIMTSTVESMPVRGSNREQARALRDQNTAVTSMVTAIEEGRATAIRADRPAAQWLEDWRTIVEAREIYIAELLEDAPSVFALPLDPSGDPVDLRMDEVFLEDSACRVPPVLLDPFPEFDAEV